MVLKQQEKKLEKAALCGKILHYGQNNNCNYF